MSTSSLSPATAVELAALVDELTLEEKVSVLTGADFWSTVSIERIGLRSMVLSDGPSGVRGPTWDERDPSLNLPSASALSASFDPEVAKRYGAIAAGEARRKGVHVVLGPTINLHRSPYGGRHFEAFSEDPLLTAQLAASYVSGVQEGGVAATLKHYIANDSETDRFTVDVHVSDRALRELYLLPFEHAVTHANAWSVMSAYNSVNGVTVTENDLLRSPLADEWGFDGVVVSDWTAVRSLQSAAAEQDLVMPGPAGPWGDALVAAVREGRVPEAAIDRKVHRLFRLAERVGALGTPRPDSHPELEDGRAFARSAAADGMVLLENRDELPWDASTLEHVAVIGHNAAVARTQGGGSATVIPEHTVSPLEGLRTALPHTTVEFALGATNQVGLAGIANTQMVDLRSGEPGARVVFRDAAGSVLLDELRHATEFFWFDGDRVPVSRTHQVEIAFRYRPERTERLDFGIAAAGHGRLWVDGELLIDDLMMPEGEDLGAALNSPTTLTVPIDFVQDELVDIRFVYEPATGDGGLGDALSLTVGTRAADVNADELIQQAVVAARRANVAIVVVGTNARVESEGADRSSLRLPGRQDDLVQAVAAANPRTVVVVNAGAPVIMPWRHDVAAVLVGWFGGQEFGHALADVLTGLSDPGGRLPTTWPDEETDVPVAQTTPEDGVLPYREDIHIGYRAWLRHESRPAYWFGDGLSYATTTVSRASSAPTFNAADGVHVQVRVENSSERDGKTVVLVFAEKADSKVDRPHRWLVGFAPIHTSAGAVADVEIKVSGRRFAYWDNGWQYETGNYTLRVGTSAAELPQTLQSALTE